MSGSPEVDRIVANIARILGHAKVIAWQVEVGTRPPEDMAIADGYTQLAADAIADLEAALNATRHRRNGTRT